ncbi:MAG: hypothetical protein HQK85_08555 [Nitrospinae bacterium]|nr:hypothetical protein [Nitrospinota bacterium]
MISTTGRKTMEGSLRNLSIIWVVMLGAAIAIIAVTAMMSNGGKLPVPSGMDNQTQVILLAVLSVLALSEIGGIVLFSVLFKSEGLIKKRLEVAPPELVNAQSSEGGLLTETDRVAIALTPLYFSLCVIRWTLGLSVSLYGFILAFVTQFMNAGALFYAVSFLTLALLRPGIVEIETMAAKAGIRQ